MSTRVSWPAHQGGTVHTPTSDPTTLRTAACCYGVIRSAWVWVGRACSALHVHRLAAPHTLQSCHACRLLMPKERVKSCAMNQVLTIAWSLIQLASRAPHAINQHQRMNQHQLRAPKYARSAAAACCAQWASSCVPTSCDIRAMLPCVRVGASCKRCMAARREQCLSHRVVSEFHAGSAGRLRANTIVLV